MGEEKSSRKRACLYAEYDYGEAIYVFSFREMLYILLRKSGEPIRMISDEMEKSNIPCKERSIATSSQIVFSRIIRKMLNVSQGGLFCSVSTD